MENSLQKQEKEAIALDDIRRNLQNFSMKMSAQPPVNDLKKTPDKKALYLPIDFVETQLDEFFFGLWSTENFRWASIANEVQGSIDLLVFHPTAKIWLKRTGAASIVIMVDAIPEELKDDRQAKNRWGLDPSNKKSNALDLGFPKLKTECIKNAAASLGNLFGRNLNRENKDTYTPIKTQWTQQ